jgi:predicted nucleic acid-binding protein
MICVDTNIICYRYMRSPHSAAADAAWAKDADWIVPILWRSEFRNALAGSMRRRSLTAEEAISIANLAEHMLGQKEFTVSTSTVLQLVSRSKCSAYDCEFVALAHAQEVQLVTTDRQVLREFPEVAISLDKFVRD